MDDRRVRRPVRVAAVVALCASALAGCSAGGSTADTGSEDLGFHLAQVESGPPTTDRTIRVERVPAPPHNDHDWTVSAVDPASRTLRLNYLDGACTSADRLALQETARTVVVGITASKSFSGNCIAAGIPRSTTITLRKPLGGRALMEGATGTNDGLHTVSDPTMLPEPTCSTAEGSGRDVPVGLPSAATRVAPPHATTAFVCRTWWPKGSAHVTSRTITDRAEVDALAASIDAGTADVRPAGGVEPRCTTRLPGSWYDITFEGPGVHVEVRTDEINCLTITNGAASGTITPALAGTLDALFPG